MTHAFLRTLTRGNHCEIEAETAQGRADVGDMLTAEILGSLARNVLSTSRLS